MKIEHIAISVKNLEQEKEFFEKYFNARSGALYENKTKGFSSYFLSFEDGARLELMHNEQMDDPHKSYTRTGFIHMAISVGSPKKVDEITKALKADGYTVISGPRTTGDGYYESCVLDKEENQIEITV